MLKARGEALSLLSFVRSKTALEGARSGFFVIILPSEHGRGCDEGGADPDHEDHGEGQPLGSSFPGVAEGLRDRKVPIHAYGTEA